MFPPWLTVTSRHRGLEISRVAGTTTAIERLGFLPCKSECPLQGLGLGSQIPEKKDRQGRVWLDG